MVYNHIHPSCFSSSSSMPPSQVQVLSFLLVCLIHLLYDLGRDVPLFATLLCILLFVLHSLCMVSTKPGCLCQWHPKITVLLSFSINVIIFY